MKNDTQIKKHLNEIAAAMKKPGANLEKLSAEIDRLLGTELPPEDTGYLAAGMKRARRGR